MDKSAAGISPGTSTNQQADLLEITFYTDPLCCWSWAFEPAWRRFLYEYDGKIAARYCMGGLLPGWENYRDTINSVSKPGQMGPVWMHAGRLSGMPIQHDIWVNDPPASSYPACIAVKAAGLQSTNAEELLLRLLREAVMIRGENISRQTVLINAANQLCKLIPNFDVNLFIEDMKNGKGKEAFRKDLQEVQYLRINRFPSLVIKNAFGQAIMLTGYRDYHKLVEATGQVASLSKTHEAIIPAQYEQYWHGVTERELQEIS